MGLFNKEKIMRDVRLEVVKKDWNKERLDCIVHRDIEGIDLAFIPIVETEETIMRFLFPMLELLGLSEDEVMDRAIKNMVDEKWTINYNMQGLCYISPSACAFIPEKVSSCYDNDGGFYILPFSKRSVELVKESVMEKDEVVEAFKMSLKDLTDMCIVNKDNMLSDRVYLFKDGKYSIL